MKDTRKKKPKVFRTLIRLIRTDDKEIQDQRNGQAAGKKTENQ